MFSINIILISGEHIITGSEPKPQHNPCSLCTSQYQSLQYHPSNNSFFAICLQALLCGRAKEMPSTLQRSKGRVHFLSRSITIGYIFLLFCVLMTNSVCNSLPFVVDTKEVNIFDGIILSEINHVLQPISPHHIMSCCFVYH